MKHRFGQPSSCNRSEIHHFWKHAQQETASGKRKYHDRHEIRVHPVHITTFDVVCDTPLFSKSTVSNFGNLISNLVSIHLWHVICGGQEDVEPQRRKPPTVPNRQYDFPFGLQDRTAQKVWSSVYRHNKRHCVRLHLNKQKAR